VSAFVVSISRPNSKVRTAPGLNIESGNGDSKLPG
jgi:hypothetical protein